MMGPTGSPYSVTQSPQLLPYVVFTAQGAGDWARLANLWAAVAGKKAIVLAPGTYAADSVQTMPSGLVLLGGPQVTIVSTIVNNAVPTNSAFCALHTSGGLTTLAAPCTYGSRTISTVASIAPGTIIEIADSVSGSGFHVTTVTTRSVTGVGPFTVTVDRPILNTFGVGDNVGELTNTPTDILIDGLGMTITGTGTRFFEIDSAFRCRIQNVNIHVTSGVTMDLLASFDTGGYQNEFRNVQITIDTGATVLGALALEANESSRIVDCAVLGGADGNSNFGYAIYDSVLCTLENSDAAGFVYGANIGADGNVLGCIDFQVQGGSFIGNSSFGIFVLQGSTGTQIFEPVCQKNTVGLQIGGDGSALSKTRVVGGTFTLNTGGGITIGALATKTSIAGVETGQNGTSSVTGTGLTLSEDTLVQNWTISGTGNGAGAMVFGANCRLHVDGFDFTFNTGTPINCVVTPAGSTSFFQNGIVRIGTNCNAFNSAGSLGLSNVKIEPVPAGVGTVALVNTGTGCTRIGPDVDVSACATGFFSPGSNFSRDTLVANGAAAVAYSFPDIRATDFVSITRKVDGGTPGLTPKVVITPGTGFSITGVALDTSTYAFEIQ